MFLIVGLILITIGILGLLNLLAIGTTPAIIVVIVGMLLVVLPGRIRS